MGVEIDSQTEVWIEQQVGEFARRRPDYVVFADTLQQVLDYAAKRYCPLAIVQVRAKGVASFGGKALRKRREHPDPVHQFTDLCGARLIAQTRDQVEAVCEFLKAHFVIDWENSVDTSERLRATEFGYRSVHYIVSFKPGALPTKDVPVEVPARLLTMPNPRAEVQVRTMLEHVWADLSHELLYKAGFRVPRAWERKSARLAAVLEDADADIADLHDELQAYASSYAFMTTEDMRERVAQCRFVLTKDPTDLAVAREIGALCLSMADWDTAIDALEPYANDRDAAVLRDYGLALCGKHAGDPRDPEYVRGRAMIGWAGRVAGVDPGVWLALAESWAGDEPEVSRARYGEAFEADVPGSVASRSSSMTAEEMRKRVARLRAAPGTGSPDTAAAREIGALCLWLADWDTAIGALEPHVDVGDAAILRDYGLALCGKHADDPRDPEYARGRAIIDRACHVTGAGADTRLALAESWTGDDPEASREHYRKAFEIDPANERALAKYLEAEIRFEHSLETVDIVRPLIQSALERCRRRVEIGVDLATAFLTMGEFLLLLGDAYKSLAAYAKGAQVASAPHQLEEALRSLDLLRSVGARLEGYEWARRILLLRLAAWPAVEPEVGADTGAGVCAPPSAAARRARKALAALATPSAPAPANPVVMVAGGCDPALAKEMKTYRTLIVDGFKGFCGTVISGGTKEGISGLVGEMAAKYAEGVTAVTYLPEALPLDANLDRRYRVRHATPGSTFSPLQPLQAWTDLVVAGIDPDDVRLLGINGGPIAAAEYRIALALGAMVALVEESGREAARLHPDEDWGGSERLLRIPPDPAIVREYVSVSVPCLQLDPAARERVAQEIHEEYQRNRRETIAKEDAAMKPWGELSGALKESNLSQADGIGRKLERIGCTAVPVEGRRPRLLELRDGEVEDLAEVEHARWVVERLQAGWRRGPRRDAEHKVSPYLVPWSDLSEEVREWDRQTVRKIPEFLAAVGLEIRRKGDAG